MILAQPVKVFAMSVGTGEMGYRALLCSREREMLHQNTESVIVYRLSMERQRERKREERIERKHKLKKRDSVKRDTFSKR